MAKELLGIAVSAESEAVKLAAVKDALDRAGLGAKAEVALAVKPWEDIMNDVAGVANISLAESRARRGLPDEPALAEPAYDIVDAELVDDGPQMGPSSTGDACMGDGQVTGAPNCLRHHLAAQLAARRVPAYRPWRTPLRTLTGLPVLGTRRECARRRIRPVQMANVG